MNDLVNYSKIIEKIKKYEKLSLNKDVAELWNLSENDFSQRKKRGTLLNLIISWAIKKDVSLEWLIKGKSDTAIAEDRPGYTAGYKKCPVDCDDDFIDLCRKVKEVIDSPYSYSESLKANIHSFHEAVEEKRGKKAKSVAGTSGGAQKSPAERTAKVRRAG